MQEVNDPILDPLTVFGNRISTAIGSHPSDMAPVGCLDDSKKRVLRGRFPDPAGKRDERIVRRVQQQSRNSNRGQDVPANPFAAAIMVITGKLVWSTAATVWAVAFQ